MKNRILLSSLLALSLMAGTVPMAMAADDSDVTDVTIVSMDQLKKSEKTEVKKDKSNKKSSKSASQKKNSSAKNTDNEKQDSAGTINKLMDRGPLVEVGLVSGADSSTITGVNKFTVDAGSGKSLGSYPKGTALTATAKGKIIFLNGRRIGPAAYLRASTTGGAFTVKGNTYRGDIKIIPSSWNSGVTVVNDVALEDYVYGVVPYEVPYAWKPDALRAQAVAARTYAVYNKGRFASSGFDLTDDTRSQVYHGVNGEQASTNQAVDDTRGEIITYEGKPIDALFSANGGGYTENSENVWGNFVPYLRGVPEEEHPVIDKPWTVNIPITSLQSTLGIGKLKNIKLSHLKKGPMHVADRGISGRVLKIVFTGTGGTRTVTGNRFQQLFGLNSTLFDLNVKGKNVIVTGYGWGHGLGLTQWGAEAMAEKHGGDKDYYKEILKHYYTGVSIEKM